MRTVSGLLSIALLSTLVACAADDEAVTEQAEAAEAAADKDHVWKEQVETIDRAKDVEKTIKEADEAKRKAMKDAGGG